MKILSETLGRRAWLTFTSRWTGICTGDRSVNRHLHWRQESGKLRTSSPQFIRILHGKLRFGRSWKWPDYQLGNFWRDGGKAPWGCCPTWLWTPAAETLPVSLPSSSFPPFTFKGLTWLAVAEEALSIVASDPGLSEGFLIHTWQGPNCNKLTDKAVIESSCFRGECLTLAKITEARIKMYKHDKFRARTMGQLHLCLLQSSIQGASFHITFITSSGWRSKGCRQYITLI